MRRLILLAAFLLTAFLLNGCAAVSEVENQAYALVLGIEGSPDGAITLTIRIPRIGQKSGGDESGSGDEPYLVLSAEGGQFTQALEHLQWAAARELNLSHIKLIIVSEDLARSEVFPSLIREVAETRHLYTTAGFVVCRGSAQAFIEGQETILGTRLSSEINAMFRHYASHGAIPRATFADLYYDTLSGTIDPVGIMGFLDQEEATQDVEAGAVVEGSYNSLKDKTQTASARQYLGTALFHGGRMVGTLDARETLYLNLLTSKLDSFTYGMNDMDHVLSCVRVPHCGVHISGNETQLFSEIWLTCEDTLSREMANVMETDMASELDSLILKCQQDGLDPFGFGERAAPHFLTLKNLQRWNWSEHYPSSSISVRVHISCSGE